MTELPEGWSRAPLGHLVDILDSQRVPVSAKERASRSGPVPYYGATGQVGRIDRPLFDEELVLVGEDGVQFFDPGKPKAYRIVGPAWVNNHAHVLRARDIDARYLTHYLNQVDYRGLANGTTRLKLTQAAMCRVPVMSPPLDEQRRIVEILEDHLSRLDAADAYLEAASWRLSSLMTSWFSAEGLNRGPRMRLKDLLAEPLSNGRSVPTREGGFPVLRLTALAGERVDLTQCKSGDWNAEDARRFLVKRGDFLASRGNGSLRLVARGALVEADPGPVAFPDTMIRVRARQDLVLPKFLAMMWNSPVVRRQIEQVARTTAGIYKVNQAQLGEIELPMVSLDHQRLLLARADELRGSRARLGTAGDLAKQRDKTLRRALLHAAFTGRLTGRGSDADRINELATEAG